MKAVREIAAAVRPAVPKFTPLAEAVYRQKYSHEGKEDWADIAARVAFHVCAPWLKQHEVLDVAMAIAELRFLPGGRYLYAAGRPFHQTSNCLLLGAEDSREGWADLMHKAGMALMTGAGIGVDYSALRGEGTAIRKTGGVASGPLALMKAVNDFGRQVQQGGARRSAIWAGLSWKHPDVLKFIRLKDWPKEVRKIKEKDFDFPATMDFTNVSVLLDDEFFESMGRGDEHAKAVWDLTCRQMLSTAEPGFSVDIGENAGETKRNAPLAGGTHVLTVDGYRTIKEIAGKPATVWTGVRWAPNVVFSRTGENAPMVRVSMSGGRAINAEPWHEFIVERWEGSGSRRRLARTDRVPADKLRPGDVLAVSLPSPAPSEFDESEYTLGWLYGDGSFSAGGGADLTLCTAGKEACAEAMDKSMHSGFKRDSRGFLRAYFPAPVGRGRNKDRLPASTSCSFLAGLFDADGNVCPAQKRVRLSSTHEAFAHDVRRALEAHGVLSHVSKNGVSTFGQKQTWQVVVTAEHARRFFEVVPVKRLSLDFGGWKPFRAHAVKVLSVVPAEPEDSFCADVGFPEHSFQAEGVLVANCCEVTTADDSDVCNLGSVNLARCPDLSAVRDTARIGMMFQVCGTLYTDVPYPKVREVLNKNRRIGQGLMGVHEWLLSRGLRYGACPELGVLLAAWAEETRDAADETAARLGVNPPVKCRAIAPTGTIGIVGMTTTGIEPVFCKAYKRRYRKGNGWAFQYVLDPTVKRLVDAGLSPDDVEDAYGLARDVSRRLEFQAFVQKHVDHAISSTVNLPAWGSEHNNPDTEEAFKDALWQSIRGLRGVTCYPDGARGGQPLTAVDWAEAAAAEGQVYEAGDACVIGKGGTCGE